MQDGTEIGYVYDHVDRRVGQTVDGSLTNYLWDEATLFRDVIQAIGIANVGGPCIPCQGLVKIPVFFLGRLLA